MAGSLRNLGRLADGGARLVDISMPLGSGYRMHTPVGVEDVQLSVDVIKHYAEPGGAGQIVRAMRARLHHGTHVDAPEHFVEGGLQIMDLPLETFVCPAVVADLHDIGRNAEISVDRLERAMPSSYEEGDSLLIRTDWTDHYGTPDYVDGSPFLSLDSIEWCAKRKFPIVGMDFAHTKDPPGAPGRFYTTRYFCEQGVVTMGYVNNLATVHDSRVLLIALPLAIEGVEASPVRAVVVDGAFPQ